MGSADLEEQVEILKNELLQRQQELRSLRAEVAMLRRTQEMFHCLVLAWVEVKAKAGLAGLAFPFWHRENLSDAKGHCLVEFFGQLSILQVESSPCGVTVTAMASEYVDPFLKQGFDGDRIRCGGCLGGLLILGSVASAVPLLFVPIWINVPSTDLIRWKPLPGRPPPLITATLFRFDFEKPEWTGAIEIVPGFDWLDFCRFNVNDTLPVAKKLIEGTIFTPDPLEADPQVCLGATISNWLTMVGVLSIAGADLFILLSGLVKSILLLLFGGWLALLSAFALLLALGGLFLVDAKHLGTAPGVSLLGSSVAFAFVGTTMALYQAMRATPDHLPKERPKWKDLWKTTKMRS
eukprot:symbB.v1.2.003513.t1/scaffold201.1/size272743/5